MKKLISLILLCCMLLTPIAALSEDEIVIEPISGVIIDIGDDALLLENADLGYVIVKFAETTEISGVEALEPGMFAYVVYNGMMTRSIPAQITADAILVHRLSGEVTAVEEDSFMINDATFGEVIVHWENAALSVAVGSPAVVYYDGVMALSLPGQVNAQKVDTYTLTGTIFDMCDGGFLLEGEDGGLYQVNVSENTFSNIEIVPAAKVTVLYNGMMTRSIPAQVNALSVLNAEPAEELPTETVEDAAEETAEETSEETSEEASEEDAE